MRSHGNVLLVNSYDERAMYGEFLRHHRLAVADFPRPEEALASLDGHFPDVIVTDLVFVDSALDGPAFIRTLRSRLDAATSILVVSGYGRQEDGERARAAGADLFLIKPVLPRDILYEVRRALSRRGDGHRLQWNWNFVRLPKPDVDRRSSDVRLPHSRGAHASN
jgi:DNA-binding response OmpR family regulator